MAERLCHRFLVEPELLRQNPPGHVETARAVGQRFPPSAVGAGAVQSSPTGRTREDRLLVAGRRTVEQEIVLTLDHFVDDVEEIASLRLLLPLTLNQREALLTEQQVHDALNARRGPP